MQKLVLSLLLVAGVSFGQIPTSQLPVIPVANGGTGTTSPAIQAGTGITVTGTWPNQTITSSAVSVPASGSIVKSTGSALAAAVAGTDYMSPSTSVSLAQLPTVARAKTCELHIWGSGASSAIQSTADSEPNSCFNDGATAITITAVRCLADNSSTTTSINPTLTTGGTAILSSALTCGNNTFANGVVSGTPSLASGATINATISAAGTAKSLRIIISGTY